MSKMKQHFLMFSEEEEEEEEEEDVRSMKP